MSAVVPSIRVAIGSFFDEGKEKPDILLDENMQWASEIIFSSEMGQNIYANINRIIVERVERALGEYDTDPDLFQVLFTEIKNKIVGIAEDVPSILSYPEEIRQVLNDLVIELKQSYSL